MAAKIFTSPLKAWLMGVVVVVFCQYGSQTTYGQGESPQPGVVKFTTLIPGDFPPVKVVQVLIDNKPIPLNVTVPVDHGWVGRIVVEIQNVTHKNLTYGEIILEFPETGTGVPSDNKPIFTDVTSIGRKPAAAYLRRDGTSRPIPESRFRRSEISIPPGGTMRFEFNRDPLDDPAAEASRLAGGAIHLVTLVPRTFFFADGSRWQGGGYLIPAPPPVLWKEVSPSEF